MNLSERRTFWACASAGRSTAWDFMIYPLVIGTITTLWKVDAGTAGLAGTVTLLASAVGGWLAVISPIVSPGEDPAVHHHLVLVLSRWSARWCRTSISC